MRAAALALGLAGCAGVLAPRADRARSCPAGISGTFLQVTHRELREDAAGWRRILQRLRAAGAEVVVLQFSGDEHGPFERQVAPRTPIRWLLAAAEELRMEVLLGLHLDPRWPHTFPVADALPPPLDDPAAAGPLFDACAASRACVGFYLPHELEDRTWSPPAARPLARGFLARSAAEVRRRAPGKRIAIAPYFTRALPPDAHARFWAELLDGSEVDLLMLQDGVGAGHALPEEAGRYLAALERTLGARAPRPIELWSVLELFHQQHGPPRDDRPFSARPADFSVVRRSLELERPHVTRVVAFAVRNYMDPDAGIAAAWLLRRYVGWCDAQPRRP